MRMHITYITPTPWPGIQTCTSVVYYNEQGIEGPTTVPLSHDGCSLIEKHATNGSSVSNVMLLHSHHDTNTRKSTLTPRHKKITLLMQLWEEKSCVCANYHHDQYTCKHKVNIWCATLRHSVQKSSLVLYFCRKNFRTYCNEQEVDRYTKFETFKNIAKAD